MKPTLNTINSTQHRCLKNVAENIYKNVQHNETEGGKTGIFPEDHPTPISHFISCTLTFSTIITRIVLKEHGQSRRTLQFNRS